MPRRLRLASWRGALALCLVLAGAQQLAAAGLIQAKAWLAPLLIERAWQRTASAADQIRPWPWADTWPVARLRVPARRLSRLVLAGATGNALAFGPGHARASAPPGSAGLVVIAAHRDTHFAFLREVGPGERIELELPGGALRRYRVESTRVVDSRREALPVRGDRDALLLVTCFPFGALRAGGPLRYVVSARPEDPPRTLAGPPAAPAPR